MQVGADVPDDDRAGVDANSHLKAFDHSCKFACITPYTLLDIERGSNRTDGIVFVSNGRTEEGQHAIAKQLGDGALVTVDRFTDALVSPGDNLLPLFGIQFFGDGGGTDDVGE